MRTEELEGKFFSWGLGPATPSRSVAAEEAATPTLVVGCSRRDASSSSYLHAPTQKRRQIEGAYARVRHSRSCKRGGGGGGGGTGSILGMGNLGERKKPKENCGHGANFEEFKHASMQY